MKNINLSKKNLRNVDTRNKDLRGADLCFADLREANLIGADLNDANLDNVNLTGANLSNANLCGANLVDVHLSDTDLSDAVLDNANLCSIRLLDAKGKLLEYRKGKMLTENIIGYKKCIDNIIVTLEIPRGAIVFSIDGYKCRTNKAKVIAIDGADRAISRWKYMSYYIGDEFTVYDFNCQYNIECSTGIHFFMTKEEAEDIFS